MKIAWKNCSYVLKAGILLGFLFIANMSEAQSMYSNGKECAKRITDTEYATVPNGVVTYTVEKGEYWQLYSGEAIADKPYGYVKKVNSGFRYYNSEKDLIGYFISSQNRYYMTTSTGGDNIRKEIAFAVISEGYVYGSDESEQPRFRVDDNFSREWLGFFLFFNF